MMVLGLKIRLYPASAIVVAVLMAPSDVRGAEPTTISICNSGNTKLSVARFTNAWYGDGNYSMTGWFSVPASGLLSSCEYFHYRGYPGSYYFAFLIDGKNGTGAIRPRVNGSRESRWDNGWQNSARRFCVNPVDVMEIRGARPAFEDLANCPPGWALAPFPVHINAGPGSYKLTINADKSATVEQLTSIARSKPPYPDLRAAEQRLNRIIISDSSRKYSNRGAVQIADSGMMTISWVIPDRRPTKKRVRNVPLGSLDIKRTANDGWSSAVIFLRCQDERECVVNLDNSKRYASKWASLGFANKKDAETALAEIRAMIQHYGDKPRNVKPTSNSNPEAASAAKPRQATPQDIRDRESAETAVKAMPAKSVHPQSIGAETMSVANLLLGFAISLFLLTVPNIIAGLVWPARFYPFSNHSRTKSLLYSALLLPIIAVVAIILGMSLATSQTTESVKEFWLIVGLAVGVALAEFPLIRSFFRREEH